MLEPGCDYPEHWSVVRWIDGEHPEVVTPEAPADPRRADLAMDLAEVVDALGRAEVPSGAVGDPALQWYRGEPGRRRPSRMTQAC